MLIQHKDFKASWKSWISRFFSESDGSVELRPLQTEAINVSNCKSTRLIVFLREIGMEPHPENYQMAWEYHYGASARFRSEIDQAIEKNGYLTEAMARQITADYLNQWNAVELAKLVSGGDQILRNGSKVIRKSHKDNRNYGMALEKELDKIEAPSEYNACHFTALVSLTKTMAVKSIEAQRQLQEASETLDGMRNKLADATQKAETDQLTGLPNRWAFEKHLANALLRAREAMEPLSVAFVDVDHFKGINDTHGHDTGDRVLKRIASTLDQLSDNHCHVARHGGEEFVLLFINKSAEEAEIMVDRARLDLCEHDFTNRTSGKKLGQVSFSAGISNLSADGDGRAMLRRADSALYQAKENGRNQIAVSVVCS